MREAYLVNLSQSITSIPLYEKIPVTVRGREVQQLQFKTLVPRQEFPVGFDISPEKKKFYQQFKPIMVELKFREVKAERMEENKEGQKVEEPSAKDEVPVTEPPVQDEVPKEIYDFKDLMKKRQAELIEIAKGLGIEATTQDSKADISKMILEKQLG